MWFSRERPLFSFTFSFSLQKKKKKNVFNCIHLLSFLIFLSFPIFTFFSSHFLPSSSFFLFLHFRSLSLCFFLFLSLILLHFSFRCKIQNTQVRKQQRSVVIDAHVTLNSLINWRLKKLILDLDTKHIWKQKHFFSQHKIQNGGHFVHGQFTEHSSVRLVATRPKRNYASHRSVGLPAIGQSRRRTGRRQRNVEGSKSERPSGININFFC